MVRSLCLLRLASLPLFLWSEAPCDLEDSAVPQGKVILGKGYSGDYKRVTLGQRELWTEIYVSEETMGRIIL